MDFGEFLVVFITLDLALLGVWKIIEMIRGPKKEKRVQEYEESFDYMAEAFIQHKNDMERRLRNIEAIISQEKEPTFDRIEIEESIENNENSETKNLNKVR